MARVTKLNVNGTAYDIDADSQASLLTGVRLRALPLVANGLKIAA